jgi:tetratricopeptide (TPR) repeat protein
MRRTLALGLGPVLAVLVGLGGCGDPCVGAREILRQAVMVSADRDFQRQNYLKAIKKCPTLKGEMIQMAREAMAQRSIEDALTLLQAVIEYDAAHGPAHLALGEALLARGNTRQAVQSFAKAKELMPENPQIYLQLANAAARAQDTEQAVQAYREALAKGADPSRVYYELGRLQMEAGNLEGARESFRQATQQERPRPEALYYLGLIAQEQGRHPEAMAYLERAVQFAPQLVEAREALGNVSLLAGDLNLAIEHLGATVQIDPSRIESFNNLAWVLFLAGRTEEAHDIASVGIQFQPRNLSLRDTLGHVLLARGEFNKANAVFQDIIDRRRDNAWTQYGLGLSYKLMGIPAKAAEHFAEAARLNAGEDPYLNRRLEAEGYAGEAEE